LIAGQMMYYSTLNTCTSYILNNGDERLKTELATMYGSLYHDTLLLLSGVLAS
jgi:hypothetical protein